MRTRQRRSVRITAGLAALSLLAVGLPTAALASSGDVADQVGAPVPEIAWGPCEGEGLEEFECASVEVPTDYDRPHGATTTIALTRLPATDPDARVGSLFLNFGGPGGPGVSTLHLLGGDFLAPEVRASFDVIGFDPRGVGLSDPATCFRDPATENAFLADQGAFPVTPREEARYLASTAVLATSCAALSGDRISHASTANVARDMDLLRQAVGDEQLSYLGYSYGTVLGATYGALFPDRVRAMVLDGTLDPEAWSGGEGSLGLRIGQGEAASGVFDEFLRLCAEAGAQACPLAALGEPGAVVEALFAQLQEQPVDVPMPDGSSTEIGYDDAVALAFQSLYSPVAWTDLAATLAGLAQLAAPQQPQARTTQSDVDSLGELLRKLGLIEDYPSIGGALASMCVDGDHPLRPWDYPAQADAADETAPHFGRMRSWVGVQCDVIQFRDRDAYTGPWEQQTDAPVLVIGTRHDPATPYSFTQPYADHFLDARVLTVEGYGHTTIGLSACADAAIATYLVDLEATDGATCAQDVAPFQTGPAADELQEQRLALSASVWSIGV